ncbi:hypothetical protein [Candidatus Clostridium radicumherbarum]
MKYIGPFLRMNTLKSNIIEKQLFFLAKESLKYLVLNSKCGITISSKDLKIKNVPNFDISTIGSFSPLLCIYKKGSPKLINIGGGLCFDEDSLKKEINIEGNSLMTLGILELIDYYKKFEGIDNKKHSLGNVYLLLAKKQLEFYAANFRNIEGLFVDKKHTDGNSLEEYKFEEKNKKFKFSDQAFLMAAYYKYSLFDDSALGNEYKSFALDIFNMFNELKDELYLSSYEELTKLSFAINLFYSYSKLPEAKLLFLDIMEFILEGRKDILPDKLKNELETDCLFFINCLVIYKDTEIIKFKDTCDNIHNKLLELYMPEKGLFLKAEDKKESLYSSLEIVLYLLSILSYMKFFGESKDGNMIAVDVYKRQLIDSGIILSWPVSPDLDDVERYRNFTSKSEDIIDEQEFRMPNVPAPDSVDLAPIFIKNISYNKKKESFTQSKLTFDSSKNMFIYLLIIYLNKFTADNP